MVKDLNYRFIFHIVVVLHTRERFTLNTHTIHHASELSKSILNYFTHRSRRATWTPEAQPGPSWYCVVLTRSSGRWGSNWFGD